MMMTPQLFIKLRNQIARQAPEADALEAQAATLQPGVDAAQAVLASCQSASDAAQAVLAEAQTIEGADTTAQQEAVNAAQQALEGAKSELSKAKAPQDTATAHAKQIRDAMAQCQAAIDAGGPVADAEIAQYAAQKEAGRIIAAFTDALEAHYDATAQTRQYDSRYTCSLRAGYAGPFQAEGTAFAQWMDTCNAQAYATMSAVQAGQRTMPASPDALIAEMPPMVWPGV